MGSRAAHDPHRVEADGASAVPGRPASAGGSAAVGESLAQQIYGLLTVHATFEEEIFYPATREAIDDRDLFDEAEVEHASAEDLFAQVEAMDAGVKVLGECVRYPVEDEEGELFPQCPAAGMSLTALGRQPASRRQALTRELGDEAARGARRSGGRRFTARRRRRPRAPGRSPSTGCRASSG